MKNESRELKEKSKPRLRLRVSAAAETQLRGGHPWVYADSIREQTRAGQPGELAVIFDRKDKFLAVGLLDPDSPIRVRILHAGKPKAIDSRWWPARLAEAVERRRGLFDDQTAGYRLINGESDGWPGLVLDCYGATLVLKLYTAAWLVRLNEIAGYIQTQLKPERMVLRLSRNVQRRAASPSFPVSHESDSGRDIALQCPRPRSSGRNPGAAERGADGATRHPCQIQGECKRDGEILWGPSVTGPVTFLESGLRFEADVLQGQKTGFFLDQRENRRKVESLARGRDVLNAFSFTGGFSLYAARGGAGSVIDLDISAHALAAAKRNFALNETNAAIARCRHESVQADVFDWLKTHERRQFDLIILDPPSFAKRESERAGAIRAYEKLAALGIARLARGGILLACSCSAHVTAEEFFEAVRRGAVKSGRKFEELQTTQHPADHPATFKEAQYLKGIYLSFS